MRGLYEYFVTHSDKSRSCIYIKIKFISSCTNALPRIPFKHNWLRDYTLETFKSPPLDTIHARFLRHCVIFIQNDFSLIFMLFYFSTSTGATSIGNKKSFHESMKPLFFSSQSRPLSLDYRLDFKSVIRLQNEGYKGGWRKKDEKKKIESNDKNESNFEISR